MANEAVLMVETELPIMMTCANATGIEKGTHLTLSDPLTVAKTTVSTAATGGIAAGEKIASDGQTKVAVYRGGIFKVVASGAITVGEACVFENNNTVSRAMINTEHTCGLALETAADTETFLLELRPRHYNLA